MSFLQVKNNAASILAAGIDNAVTSLTVATGEGARFPTANFHTTIEDEILLCTTRSGDVLTVTRAQEGTAAAAHAIGKAVRLNITAAIIEELHDALTLSRCRAYLSANHTIAPSDYRLIEFNAISFDTNSEFNTTTHRFVAKEAGYYHAEMSVRLADVDVDTYVYIYLCKSGAVYSRSGAHTSNLYDFVPHHSDIVYLNVNNYLECKVWHVSAADASAQGGTSQTFMSVFKLP